MARSQGFIHELPLGKRLNAEGVWMALESPGQLLSVRDGNGSTATPSAPGLAEASALQLGTPAQGTALQAAVETLRRCQPELARRAVEVDLKGVAPAELGWMLAGLWRRQGLQRRGGRAEIAGAEAGGG